MRDAGDRRPTRSTSAAKPRERRASASVGTGAVAGDGRIAQIGRKIAALWREHHRLDLACIAATNAKKHRDLLRLFKACEDEIDKQTLRALGGTARTPRDAAVQAALAAEQVELLEHLARRGTYGNELGRVLRIASLSIARLLVELHGFDPAELGHTDLRRAIARDLEGGTTDSDIPPAGLLLAMAREITEGTAA